jgi:hypothetical protein
MPIPTSTFPHAQDDSHTERETDLKTVDCLVLEELTQDSSDLVQDSVAQAVIFPRTSTLTSSPRLLNPHKAQRKHRWPSSSFIHISGGPDIQLYGSNYNFHAVVGCGAAVATAVSFRPSPASHFSPEHPTHWPSHTLPNHFFLSYTP